MGKLIVRFMMGLVALLALSSLAIAQTSVPQAKPGTKDSLYNGNKLKPNPNPGGPAPVHDVIGSWAGNLVSTRGPVPPLTPLGKKLDALILSEPKVGTGNSNDPMNTCDPLGIPRNLVFETRGLAGAKDRHSGREAVTTTKQSPLDGHRPLILPAAHDRTNRRLRR